VTELKTAAAESNPPGVVPADTSRGLRVTRAELLCLLTITVAAALLRFVYVPSGGPFDQDQGVEMLAMWSALTTGQLPLFGPAATSLGSTFHHGALYYDLLMPAVWLGHGDPRLILGEIAAINVTVVPMLWWVARSIGGRTTGLIVALMVATSADMVFFSTFLWNPTFIEPGAALGVLGAWQAWRTRDPRWWLAAAAGLILAAQAHVAAGILALPLGVVFLIDVKRTTGSRRRVVSWGLASFALIVATYMPVILHEVTTGFGEVKGIVSYLSAPPGYVSADPLSRLFLAAIRIPAWPLIGWPFFELRPGTVLAVIVASSLALALPLLLLRTWRHGATISGGEVAPDDERHGVALVAFGLLAIVVGLGLGVRAVYELNATMSEQYHTAADSFAILAGGLTLGTIWQARRAESASRLGRSVAVILLVVFVGWNAAHWRPLDDGGTWVDAQTAAERIERDAAGGSIAVVPIYQPKGIESYSYPLLRDGFTLVAPDRATTLAILCDSGWIDSGCGGALEDQWLRFFHDGPAPTLIDRFDAAPERTISVYRVSR
jgi:hypothetical protein